MSNERKNEKNTNDDDGASEPLTGEVYQSDQPLPNAPFAEPVLGIARVAEWVGSYFSRKTVEQKKREAEAYRDLTTARRDGAAAAFDLHEALGRLERVDEIVGPTVDAAVSRARAEKQQAELSEKAVERLEKEEELNRKNVEQKLRRQRAEARRTKSREELEDLKLETEIAQQRQELEKFSKPAEDSGSTAEKISANRKRRDELLSELEMKRKNGELTEEREQKIYKELDEIKRRLDELEGA